MTYYRQAASGRVLTSSRVPATNRITATTQLINSTFDRLAPKFLFEARNAITSGGNTLRIPNAKGTDSLVVSAGTLAAPASDPIFGGAMSCVFTGTQALDSNLPSERWAFQHNGNGYEQFHVLAFPAFATTMTISCTRDSTSGSSTGNSCLVELGGNRTLMRVVAGATSVVSVNASTTPLSANVASYVEQGFGSQAQPNYLCLVGSVNAVAGAQAAQPSINVPAFTYRLGANRSGSFVDALIARWCATIIFDRVLTEFERQIVREYIEANYGIAAPSVTGDDRQVLSMMPFSWPRADSSNTVGASVRSWADRTRPGHIFDQATGPNQVATPVVNALFNNQLTANYTGGQWYDSNLPATAWNPFHNGSGSFWVHVYRLGTLSGNRTLHRTAQSGTSNGCVGAAYNGGPAKHQVFQTGGTVVDASTSIAPTLNATYLAGSLKTSANPQFALYIKSAQNQSGNVGPQQPSSGNAAFTMRLGALTNVAGMFLGDWAESLFFDRLLVSDEWLFLQAYFLNRYALAP